MTTHIRRDPPPWRMSGDPLTECGKPIGDTGWITRARFEELYVDAVREWKASNSGAQFDRSRLGVCLVCFSAAGKWATWDTDPVAAAIRFVDQADTYGQADEWTTAAADLKALADLAALHPGEFRRIRDWHLTVLRYRQAGGAKSRRKIR